MENIAINFNHLGRAQRSTLQTDGPCYKANVT